MRSTEPIDVNDRTADSDNPYLPPKKMEPPTSRDHSGRSVEYVSPWRCLPIIVIVESLAGVVPVGIFIPLTSKLECLGMLLLISSFWTSVLLLCFSFFAQGRLLRSYGVLPGGMSGALTLLTFFPASPVDSFILGTVGFLIGLGAGGIAARCTAGARKSRSPVADRQLTR